MRLLRAWYEEDRKYPILRLKFDIGTGRVTADATKHLRHRKWKAVFLGPAFVGVTKITRDGLQFDGFTEDPQVVALAERFLTDIDTLDFDPGKVLFEANAP
jgi:hypothetical protein